MRHPQQTKRGLYPVSGNGPLQAYRDPQLSDATSYAGITQVRFKGYSLSLFGTPVTASYSLPAIKSSKIKDGHAQIH
jgi:hypothetical protein